MKIYNTLTKKRDELVTLEPKKVKIYTCGPTTYNFIHVGNARPLCVFDTLRRYLLYRGFEVTFVQNFTDIDDKIINRAIEEGIDPVDYANRYIGEYLTDAAGLNVMPPTIAPKVSDNIDAIIDLIQNLVNNGYAYESQGDVYFRTNKFAEYGKLSHMPLDELEAGARIDVSSIKENPMDFALWKKAKAGEPCWETPWGMGRPGWHIECSAMVKRFLGDTIDIHCGGQDLVFPHHENEIAQSECANGCEFSRYWMHNGYINVDNKKMSKSAGTMFTTRDVASAYGYEAIRMLSVQAHYRSQINYTAEVMEACKVSVERLATCKDTMKMAAKAAVAGDATATQLETLERHRVQFVNAMDDDLNTADALAAIFELVREINTELNSKSGAVKGYIDAASLLFSELCGVLGLLLTDKNEEIPQAILDMVEQRKAARAAKDFAEADRIRDEIIDKGYNIEETRQGVKVSYAKH